MRSATSAEVSRQAGGCETWNRFVQKVLRVYRVLVVDLGTFAPSFTTRFCGNEGFWGADAGCICGTGCVASFGISYLN